MFGRGSLCHTVTLRPPATAALILIKVCTRRVNRLLDMPTDWTDFLAACATLLQSNGAGVMLDVGRPTGMFMLGLVGGVAHCSAMCAPFVLSQIGGRLAHLPVAQCSRFARLRGMALLPYHAGRITTYTLLGAAAAGFAGGAQAILLEGYAPAVLLATLGLLFLAYALQQMSPRPLSSGGGTLQHWWQDRLQPLFRRPTGLHGYLIGVVLGFLPCGLLYTALLLAGASGNWREGALAMAAFAAGTVPALLAVGYLGAVAGARWRKGLRVLMVPVLIFNGMLLLVLAARWFFA
jgi:sulfite exporter TauE/SafE